MIGVLGIEIFGKCEGRGSTFFDRMVLVTFSHRALCQLTLQSNEISNGKHDHVLRCLKQVEKNVIKFVSQKRL